MEIWEAIVLGAVQGFAEFLPISSSGHLILFQRWFGIEENQLFYSIMLHLGTLIPVVIVLWKDILGLFKNKMRRFWYLVLASIPAGVLGVVFALFIDFDQLFSKYLWLLAIPFLITAGELLLCEWRNKKCLMNQKINAKTAFIMGCGQAFGVFTGISRSGSTITAGSLARVDRKENANFAFLMSIPIILAAVGMESISLIADGGMGSIDVVPLLFGMVTAMITGYIAVKFMLSIIKKANYKWFSVYMVCISIATLITAFV